MTNDDQALLDILLRQRIDMIDAGDQLPLMLFLTQLSARFGVSTATIQKRIKELREGK